MSITLSDTVPPVAALDPEAHAAYERAQAAVAKCETDWKSGTGKIAAIRAEMSNPRSSNDPIAQLAQLRATEAALADLAVLQPILELRVATAQQALQRSIGETHRDRFRHGRALRLTASEKRADALTALAEAKAMFAKGTVLIRGAHQAGMPRPFDDSELEGVRIFPGPIETHRMYEPAEEAGLWEGLGA
jgi:hypothetical protein